MAFNSVSFFVFFPVVTLLYFIVPHQFRWFLLLVASCVFYSFFIPAYLLILCGLIIVDYTAARLIAGADTNRRKLYLLPSILSTCLALFIFKYFNFFNDNIKVAAGFFHWNYSVEALRLALPIGLSFHTFQSLSYVVEVYRGRQHPEKHIGMYALYVMFYPQLVAGPIERPQNLLHQFYEKHTIEYGRITLGLKQMLWGFFKKMVIADNLAMYVNEVYHHPQDYNGNLLLLATWFFALQIYGDFSGYSDIAIGAAKVMGFRLTKNFHQPYFARSFTEFWGRWHISLSTWFRDYLYIPLGGNKVSTLRWTMNILIVFLVSGLWHGANWTFVIWGLLHGLFLLTERFTLTIRNRFSQFNGLRSWRMLKSILSVFITFNLVSFAWIFFRAGDIAAATRIVTSLRFHPADFSSDFLALWQQLAGQQLHPLLPQFLIALVMLFMMAEWMIESKQVPLLQSLLPKAIRWSIYYVLIAMIVVFGVYESAPAFIYFQF
ncbi:MAG: MBOAT family protein [Chitinophagales bacterium]|nr:MBOAT family protein [Chitinophagales bacterium]